MLGLKLFFTQCRMLSILLDFRYCFFEKILLNYKSNYFSSIRIGVAIDIRIALLLLIFCSSEVVGMFSAEKQLVLSRLGLWYICLNSIVSLKTKATSRVTVILLW